MTELCVNTRDELEVGHIGHGFVLNEKMENVLVSIEVLNKITFEEYYEFVKQFNLTHLIKSTAVNLKFYRVRILD